MASNVREWNTEYYASSTGGCTTRGGRFDVSSACPASRSHNTATYAYGRVGFRVILYINPLITID